ncbi:nuclear transport factor 2 family protein [Brevibacterium daeguense]|uniref:Nuclear transport factor 2 family protein n=1 Tax=Brevibacterium daeguense TaxID=909936 RepID=A0ABP8EFG4_9MICO|nr:nuclear transport factor 2 family protein [Brevibacterium daeguense]
MSTASSPSAPAPPLISAWHELVRSPSPEALRELLAPDVTFRSPAVHTPQEGAEKTFAYLWAAVRVLRPTIEYQHEWYDDSSAVLQFSATIDGFEVSGVDIIEWNAEGRITEFTVMVRPLKGLQAIVSAMGAELKHQQEARS